MKTAGIFNKAFPRGFARRLILLVASALLLIPCVSFAEEAEPIRIAVLGTDSVGYQKITGSEGMSRADAIFVVAVKPGTGSIRILSVERDYLTELPEGLGKNKLSTATYFGGPGLLMNEVNELFQTDIAYYLQVDIPGAIGIIDSIGGIDVEVLPEEISIVNSLSTMKPKAVVGMNHFNGKQAQTFMRVRDISLTPTQSNVARNDRQMRAVKAILRKMTDLSFGEALAFLGKAIPLVRTNIPVYELMLMAQSLALDGRNIGIEYARSPITSFKTKRVNMHLVVIPDDMESEILAVHRFLLYTE